MNVKYLFAILYNLLLENILEQAKHFFEVDP